MNMWFWKSKGQKEPTLDQKIQSALKGGSFKKVPSDISKLDDSYRMLIRELAKR
jgi:hypothetical protein